jgi:gliding motility-associated-like protein
MKEFEPKRGVNMKNRILKVIFVALTLILAQPSTAQISVTAGLTGQQMLDILVGSGVVVSNVNYTGIPIASGSFNNGGTTNIGLQSGVILTSGSVNLVPGPNNQTGAGMNNQQPGDVHLNALIPGYTTYDASVLTFEFIPLSDTIKFRYVFGSEEYPEYVNSSFNDVFGFFISGPNPLGGTYNFHNIARLPGTTIPVSINNVNNGTNHNGPCVNCQYYINNTGGATIQYDGFTTVLTAWALVTPCLPYQFKIAIADAGDGILDSGVFLEENSFSTDALQVSTDYSIPGAGKYAIEGCNNAIINFKINKFATDTVWIYIDTIYGTATNGVDFPMIPNYVFIPPGHNQTSIVVAPYVDYITEGMEYITLVIPTTPCTVDTITIYILDYDPISLNMMSDTLVCEASLPLTVTPSLGAPPYSYTWSPNTTLSNPNAASPIATPTTTTTYTVVVSDTTACPPVSASVVVTVSPLPSVSFMPDPFAGCEPLTVSFTDFSSPNIVAWNWSFGNGNTSNVKNPTTVYNAGNYTVGLEVTTADGCKGSISFANIIQSYPQPNAWFDPNPAMAAIDNPTIQFTDLSTHPGTWFWDFGDPGSGANNNSTLQHPSHTYADEGEFTVCLTVRSPQGCIDSACRKVLIVVDEIEIPNVITPNGDGKNDYFTIKNIDKVRYSKLVIFNRWGQKIYEKEPYDNSWDARGHSDGVYFWILEYSTFFRDAVEHGTVTVLRN